MNNSGVVIRGSGDGENPTLNTIIRGVGNIPDERTLIRIGTNNKSGFGGQVAGTRQDIIVHIYQQVAELLKLQMPQFIL